MLAPSIAPMKAFVTANFCDSVSSEESSGLKISPLSPLPQAVLTSRAAIVGIINLMSVRVVGWLARPRAPRQYTPQGFGRHGRADAHPSVTDRRFNRPIDSRGAVGEGVAHDMKGGRLVTYDDLTRLSIDSEVKHRMQTHVSAQQRT